MKEELKTIWFPMYFNKFNDLLESGGGEYIAGSSLTFGDLVVANFLEIAQDLVDPNCLDEYPKLNALKERILEIPAISAFRKAQATSKLEDNNEAEGG